MPVEVANKFSELDLTWPLRGDKINQAQSHLRQLKKLLKETFKGSGGNGYSTVVTAKESELNHCQGLTSNVQTQIDSIKNNMVRIGGITQYAGAIANIASNYQICDGTNGTPNLTNRFVRGTATQANILQTGGLSDKAVIEHSHTVNHTHTASLQVDPDHSHNYNGFSGGTTTSGAGLGDVKGASLAVTTTEAPDHLHTVSVPSAGFTTGSDGVDGTDKNIPVYYKLIFIQRMS